MKYDLLSPFSKIFNRIILHFIFSLYENHCISFISLRCIKIIYLHALFSFIKSKFYVLFKVQINI
jgi:hypothetical protein